MMAAQNLDQRSRALESALYSRLGPSDQFKLAIVGVGTLLSRQTPNKTSDGGWPRRSSDSSSAGVSTKPASKKQQTAAEYAAGESSAYLAQLADFWQSEKKKGEVGRTSLLMPYPPNSHVQNLRTGQHIDQNRALNRIATTTRTVSEIQNKAFARLPLEVNQLIMAYLPNPRSLAAAALSCRALLFAVVSAEEMLATQSMSQEIPRTLQPEAYLALELSVSQQPRTVTVNTEFSDQHLRHRQVSGFPRVHLAEAVSMSKRHVYVDYFVKMFHRYALREMASSIEPPDEDLYEMESLLNWQPVDIPAECLGPRTATEYERIARAFYRFEMYCYMFRDQPNFRTRSFRQDKQAELFFDRFSPLENEQLASVMDFLVGAIVGPALKYACEKDSAWKMHFENSDPLYDEATSEVCAFQYRILSLGLSFLYKLAKPSKRHLHTMLELPDRYELGDTMFLFHALIFCANPHLNNINNAGQGLPADTFSFFGENDIGPRTPWHWLTTNGTAAHGPYDVNVPYLRNCRKAGYVFWDMQRIESLDHGHVWDAIRSCQEARDAERRTWRRNSCLDTIELWH